MKDLTRPEIEKILDEKGKAWAIAAVIDGSIGYYCAEGARLVLKRFQEGNDECWSERAVACFGCSMLKMLSSDFGGMLFLEEHYPKKAVILTKMGRKLLELDSTEQTLFGLAYPTMGA